MKDCHQSVECGGPNRVEKHSVMDIRKDEVMLASEVLQHAEEGIA